MFKFNIKVNNEHNFKMVVNNTFDFISKAIHATIFKKLFIHNKAKSGLTIGGTKLKLASFSGTKLRELPSTLRQFVGSYVYVKAKMRFTNTCNATAKVIYKIAMRFRFNESYRNIIIVREKVLSRLRLMNTNTCDSIIKGILKVKVRFMTTCRNVNGNIIHRLILKTKPTIEYITYTTAKTRIKCKARIIGIHNSIKVIAVSVIARAKLNNSYKNDSIFGEILAAKGRFSNQSDVSNTLGTIPLKNYKGVKLKDLPVTLREFMNSYVRVLCKVRLLDGTISKGEINRSLISSKARLSDLYSDSVAMDGNLVKSKSLSTYANTKLSGLPKSLKDFAFTKL